MAVTACGLQDGAHRVYVDLRRENQPSSNVSLDRLSSYLHPEVKVVFRSAGHDAVETVNRVRHAVFRGEKSRHLLGICEVRLDRHNVRAEGRLGLNNVREN